MQIGFSVIFALFAAAAARKCGTPSPTHEQLVVSAQMALEAALDPSVDEMAAAATLVVDTYFHVLQSGTAISQGNIPDKQLQDQLTALNAGFGPSGISFKLLGITHTTNSGWYNDSDEGAMKKALRQGNYKTLNVYFQNLGGGLLGYCYYPTTKSADAMLYDGCSILFSSVPGGTVTNYNKGFTATHEIGHWFGLAHTFEGGCAGGDLIADTPAESFETSGCPTSKDTCTGSLYPGVDPIHNFMDYSYDSCMTNFTPGQTTRMFQQFNLYRSVG